MGFAPLSRGIHMVIGADKTVEHTLSTLDLAVQSISSN
jgi:hypothetical protein